MNCPHCDYENLTGAQFCEKCGQSMKAVVRPDSRDPWADGNARTPVPAAVPVPAVPPVAAPSAPVPPMPVPKFGGICDTKPAPRRPVPRPETFTSNADQALVQPRKAAAAPPELNVFAALEGAKGNFFIFAEDTMIGRGDASYVGYYLDLGDCDQAPSISRRHAMIHRVSQGIVLEDLQSFNGTFLNGQRMEPGVQALINEGDKIRFGGENFIFHVKH